MNNIYGIFISYRRAYSSFAGRVYDYLSNKGLVPFIDVEGIRQGDFPEYLKKMIESCPYFLLILRKGCFDRRNSDETDWFLEEIRFALSIKPKEILIVAEGDDFNFYAEKIPEDIIEIKNKQCDCLGYRTFKKDIETFVTNNIDLNKVRDVISWKDYIMKNSNALLCSRNAIENNYATLCNRFGKDLIDAINTNKTFDIHKNIVRKICMSCYAASIIFKPDRQLVDDNAFDYGLMFKIFTALLKDEEFSFELIINAPFSMGAEVAIKNNMLGNRALEDNPEGVFLGAYNGITTLIENNEVFNKAYKEKRFRFYLTDIVMTGAIFQIDYKENYSDLDHIKYDIYSYDITSNMDRRSVIFFKNSDSDNYEYMLNNYKYIKRNSYKKETVKDNHDKWLEAFNKIIGD